MATRSYHGCARCKKRRQKCDEQRPSCSRCLQSGAICDYSVILKWYGRVPRRPPQNPSAKRTTPQAETRTVESAGPDAQALSSTTQVVRRDEPTVVRPREIQLLEHLPPRNQALLHHFITKASLITPNKYLQEQICAQIMPIALQNPSLMYATLALAALHKMTLLNGVPENFMPETAVANLMYHSLQSLSHELREARSVADRYALLHTIRSLCVCEIYSGKADPAWRTHVEGAKAIADSISKERALTSNHGNSIADVLSERSGEVTSKWYFSIEALTALTERGLATGQVEPRERRRPGPRPLISQYETNHEEIYLDLYTGYSSDLNTAFKEIGAAAWERRRLNTRNHDWTRIASNSHRRYSSPVEESTILYASPLSSPSDPSLDESAAALSAADIEVEASWLEQSVLSMIRRDYENGLRIPLGVSLTRDELKQFSACNRAYQYSALIHIYRRVKGLQSDANDVQNCVRQILDAVTSILPVTELSPWVLLTTPIFTAGWVFPKIVCSSIRSPL